jgi:drug/metabolite transporter (DMT)-like permease
MNRSSTTTGLLVALVAATTFGTSGALIKPMLAAGWSPAAAVTIRVFIGGVVLLPFALIALRGRWSVAWTNRGRILAMAFVGVAGTQLVYFASIQRIAVGTAILIEYMAPLLLVALAWVRTRKAPKAVVLIGSVVAIGGLVLVVSPGGGGTLDPLGVFFAVLAMIGCAIYYLVAAQPSNGLPAVVLAAFGLIIGAAILALAGVFRLVPFTMEFGAVSLFGNTVGWWVPMLFIGVISTAVAYATSISASEMLGSRLASFVGLLEVVAATFFAWLLLGESLTIAQLLGGVLILVGIGFVRSEKVDARLEVATSTGAIELPVVARTLT